MTRPRMIGSIGCRSVSPAKFGRKAFTFDGTTRGLVQAAYHAGARAGDTVRANYGAGLRPYILEPALHDDRAFGLWVA